MRWTFNLYDLDRDGLISREDMEHMITAVYDLLGEDTIPVTDKFTRQRRLDELMTNVHVSPTATIILVIKI